MSTDTPSESITELLSYSQADEEGVIVKVSRQAIHEVVAENARLREELELIRAALTGDDYASLPSDLPTVRMAHTIRADHDKFRNQVRDTCHRAEQAEARALEYKTEHAALLGTSQWQETEIADLRDDVKRLMQTVSECEERALANEKDAGRYRWLRSNESVYSEDMKAPWPVVWADPEHLNNGTCPCLYEELDSAIDAAMGAKHD